MNGKKRPVIIIGAGGHAKVVLDCLCAAGFDVLGLLDERDALNGTSVLGHPVLGGDAYLASVDPTNIYLANGVGCGTTPNARRFIYEKFVAQNFEFVAFIHPKAIIGKEVSLGNGVQIMAGAIVNPGTTIGDNTIINSGAIVEHDCQIESHCHVAPGGTLAGAVVMETGSLVGTRANVLPAIRLGADCQVGAGASVIRDVPSTTTVVGVPAKEVR